jgi:YVTN family beta-propeller protein
MLRSRVRAAAARRWPLRALLALALPAALAGLLLGPASVAHAAGVGTVLYVPNTFANTVSVVDTSTDAITATIPVGQWPYYTAVTPDGSQVFVPNYRSNTVSVISAATDTVTATIPVSSGPKGVAVDATGQYAYVASSGGYLTQISTATDTVTGTVFVGDSPQTVAISPDGSTVYVGGYVGAVTVVKTATMTVSAAFSGQGGDAWSMAISPDGRYLYMADSVGFFPSNANVAVISTATDQIIAHVTVGQSGILGGIAVTPDGSSIYVSDEGQNTVSVISTATNTVTDTITGFSAPSGIAINSAGTSVWVGNMGSTTVSVVDPATNTITGSISGFPGGSWGLSESTSYYGFVGFYAPVSPQPEINEANAGRAIPMQFSLTGNQGTDIFNAGYPAVQQVNCSTGDPVNSSTLTDTDTSGDSGLQYDASTDTYTYVWKTDKAWAGTCQEFILGLNDGSTHTATFQFK